MAEETKVLAQEEEQDLNEILRVRREKLAALCEAGENPYEKARFDRTHLATEVLENYEALEGSEVTLAGRLMSRRIMGKAAFAHVLDGSGLIQMYLRIDELGESFQKFKEFDIGDIVGFTGKVFKTRTGETSVHLSAIREAYGGYPICGSMGLTERGLKVLELLEYQGIPEEN
ncbi:MAG: hypothetical protein IIY09_05560 [Clostridia bacterium]|nr:hypothetical protein [Clostridia bacterium]